jgi:hypothetical protein
MLDSNHFEACAAKEDFRIGWVFGHTTITLVVRKQDGTPKVAGP